MVAERASTASRPHANGAAAPTEHMATRLAPLTGLRFIAALLIVAFHFAPLPAGHVAASGHWLQAAARHIVEDGLLSVNFFFVLSGFILAYTYLTTDGRLRGTRGAFWVARLARVYPVYLVAFILAAAPFAWRHSSHPFADPLITAISTLTLTQAWLPYSAAAWNIPGWSLSVEAFFYLLFPIIALPFAGMNRRRLYRAFVILWSASLILPLLYWAATRDVAHGVSWANEYTYGMALMQYNPVMHLAEFLLGMVTGRLFMLARFSGRRPSRYGSAALLSAVAALGCIAALTIAPALPYLPVHSGLLDPLFALLIYGVAWNEGRLAAFLSLPVIVALGEASYAMYILHYPIWDWLTHVVGTPISGGLAVYAYFCAYLGLTIAIALLSLRLIEQPARRMIRRALS